MGYVVTTDVARGILIKPLGHYYDEEAKIKDIFCIDPEFHGEMFFVVEDP